MSEETHERFSEGEEELPDTPEKAQRGRFSEGEEELGEADPEKHRESSFAEGEEATPHTHEQEGSFADVDEEGD